MLFLKIIRKFVNNVNSSPNEYKYAKESDKSFMLFKALYIFFFENDIS